VHLATTRAAHDAPPHPPAADADDQLRPRGNQGRADGSIGDPVIALPPPVENLPPLESQDLCYESVELSHLLAPGCFEQTEDNLRNEAESMGQLTSCSTEAIPGAAADCLPAPTARARRGATRNYAKSPTPASAEERKEHVVGFARWFIAFSSSAAGSVLR